VKTPMFSMVGLRVVAVSVVDMLTCCCWGVSHKMTRRDETKDKITLRERIER
jgi:hypothetical protein